MYTVFCLHSPDALAVHCTSKSVKSYESCGDGVSKLINILFEGRVCSGVQMTTLESALLTTDSGVHGIKSPGCSGGVLSLTPTMCRSCSGSSLSPSLRTASNSLLAVHSGLVAYPGWPVYPPIHSLAVPHVRAQSHVAHKTQVGLKLSSTNLNGPLAQSPCANHFGAIAAPIHYTH